MSSAEATDRAAELRRGFDAAFAAAPREAAVTEPMLSIRVAGQPYLVPLPAIAGLHADRQVTPVPTAVPELLGIAGLRGVLVPVYSLGALLGHGPAANARWQMMTKAGGDELLALAFDELVKHVGVSKQNISPSSAPDQAYVHAVARVDELSVPILNIAAVVAAVTQRVELAQEKER